MGIGVIVEGGQVVHDVDIVTPLSLAVFPFPIFVSQFDYFAAMSYMRPNEYLPPDRGCVCVRIYTTLHASKKICS